MRHHEHAKRIVECSRWSRLCRTTGGGQRQNEHSAKESHLIHEGPHQNCTATLAPKLMPGRVLRSKTVLVGSSPRTSDHSQYSLSVRLKTPKLNCACSPSSACASKSRMK